MEWNFTHAVDIYYSCPLRQLSFHSARLVSLTDNFCSIYQAASCSISCSLNVEARMENSQCSNTRDGDSIKDVITRAVREPSRRTALSLKAVCRRGSQVNLFTEPGLPGSRLNFSFPSCPALALTPRDNNVCIIDQVSRRLSSRAD